MISPANVDCRRSLRKIYWVRAAAQMISCKQMQSWRSSHKTSFPPRAKQPPVQADIFCLTTTLNNPTIPHRCSHSHEIKPHYHAGLCLFIAIVLYDIGATQWALLSYVMTPFSTTRTRTRAHTHTHEERSADSWYRRESGWAFQTVAHKNA